VGGTEEIEAGPRLTAVILVFFTLIAAVLRAISLDSQLWCDEIVTVVNAVRVPTKTLLTSYFWDNQHALYALVAQASVAVFGDQPWTVRLPAMLFGTACVPVLYLLGRELTSQFEALAAAGLLVVSYHHIWFSQNARGYTALMLAALLSTWCLVRGVKEARWRPWLLYAVVVALGMYTHLTMLFVAVSHAAVCLWLVLGPNNAAGWRTNWRRPAGAFALAAALTLLLYAPMLADVVDFFLHKPTGMKAVSTPRWALAEAWSVLQKGLGGSALVAVPVLLGGALVMGGGLFSYLRHDRVVFFLFVLPVIVTLCGALASRGTMYPRFFFYLSGFGLLVLARGISVVGWALTSRIPGAPGRRAQVAGAALAGLLMICSAASLRANYRYPKQDFEGAMAYVEAQRAPNEVIVTVGVPATFCYQRYYDRAWQEVRGADELMALRGAGRPVWLIYAFPRYIELGDAKLAAGIRENFTVVREFYGTLSGGAVIVCRAEPLSHEKPTP